MSKKSSTESTTPDTTDIYDYLPHPLAETYPLMEGEEFDALVKDIEDNDLIEPITLHEGKILDGRNRYNACLKIKHKFGKLDFRNLPPDKDPLLFVISKNSARRHLTAEQKRELIAKLLVQRPGASSRLIASIARVSHHTVEDVRQKLVGNTADPPPPEPAAPANPTGQSAQLPGPTPGEAAPAAPRTVTRTGADGKTRTTTSSTGNKSTGKKPLQAILNNLTSITDGASQQQIFNLLFDMVKGKKIRKWLRQKEEATMDDDDDDEPNAGEQPAA